MFRDTFCIFVWWISTSTLTSFPYLLHYVFEHWFYMDLSSMLQGFVCIFGRNFVDFHDLTSNWRNLQKHKFLHYLCMVYTFVNSCFFFKCHRHVSLQLFASFCIIFCTNVGVNFVWFGHQNWLFFSTDFLTVSWCVFRRLSASKMINLGSLLRPQAH